MDISLEIGKSLFNFRVAALIKNNGKILVHHSINKDHVTLPGGRVQDGESTIVALKREIKEEIGYDCKITGNVAFLENFFEFNGKNYHELLVVHEVEFLDKSAYKKDIVAIEPHKKGKLEFLWYDLDNENKYKFIPEKLLDIIKENKEFTHLVNDER